MNSEQTQEKTFLRKELFGRGSIQGRGRLAETLRGTSLYKGARTIYVSPAVLLGQVRINVLADGKNLLVPAPGLKDGYYLLRGSRVPAGKLAFAATPAGMAEFGQRLDVDFREGFSADLLVNEVLAVDQRGNHLGDGHGFFDLVIAILAAAGGLSADWKAVAVPLAGMIQIEDLPVDPWDVPVHAALASDRLHFFEPRPASPTIMWEALSRKKIRKISPLWKLFRRMEEDSSS